MEKIINLETLAEGGLTEKVNMALREVLNNIADPNTDYKVKRKLTIEPASSTIAELMNIKPLHFVYCFEFIGYADNHQIVEYTKSYIDTSKIKFEYTISK